MTLLKPLSQLTFCLFVSVVSWAQDPSPPRVPATENRRDAKTLTAASEETLITLALTVVDKKKNVVADLETEDFTVLEDGHPQPIISFHHEDAPVSICILVDDSGSMRSKRETAAQMVMELLAAGNPSDEFLVIKFNDQAFIDQEFTSDLNRVQKGLARGSSRSGTALYDSLLASSDHLMKTAKHARRVLLVVSDGEDNESRAKLPAVLQDFQVLDRPMVYAVGLLKEEPGPPVGQARHALETLCAETGGTAFFPRNFREMHDIALRIAAEIRSQYSISYKYPASGAEDKYRKLKITVDRKDLMIHARPGYSFAATMIQKGTSK